MAWMVVGMAIMAMAVVMGGGGVSGYKNYTVGDDLGWFDKLEKPTVDYQKWASSKTFSLGDFLSMIHHFLSILFLSLFIYYLSCMIINSNIYKYN